MNSSPTKILSLLFVASFAITACDAQTDSSAPLTSRGKEVARGVRLIGRIANPLLTESSGVIASRQFPGVFWSHTDGGGPKKQYLFAMDAEGNALGEYFIGGALITDWEDIAIDDQKHLFIADTGNNDLRRTEVLVHELDEPAPKSDLRFISPRRSWKLRWPGETFDCEGLFVWQGHGYLVSKVFKDARAQIFRFPLNDGKDPIVLELVATTKIESPVTGADVSPDGKLLGLVAKSGAFVYRIDGDVARAGKGKPEQFKFRRDQIEACTFVPEGLFTTTETREIYLFTDDMFRTK